MDSSRLPAAVCLMLAVTMLTSFSVATDSYHGSGQAEGARPSAEEFVAGEYTDVRRDGKYVVNGPSKDAEGRLIWTLQGDDGRRGTADAVWTSGPAKDNPQLANRKFLDTLPAGFSYGRGTGPMFAIEGLHSQVIGVRQVGKTIAVSVFVARKTNGRDEKPAYREEEVVVFTLTKAER